MGSKHGKGTRIYIAEFDVSGEARSIDIEALSEVRDASTFVPVSAGWKDQVEGQQEYRISHAGLLSDQDDNWDEWLHSVLGSNGEPLTVAPSSPAQGDRAYCGKLKEISIRRSARIDDLVAINGDYILDGPLGAGLLAGFQTTAQGSFTGTGYDLDVIASATQMWLVCIHITEVNLNSGTNYIIKLQESSNDGGGDAYADVATATLTATVPTSLFITVAGAREQWVRVVGTPTNGGGTPTAKFAVSVAIVALQ